MEPEPERDVPGDPARARRAKLLGAVSIVALALAGLAYLRPSQPAVGAFSTATGFQLDAVDFVNPSTGWVLLDLNTQQFAVLRTGDSGRHWASQLTAPSLRHGEYMRFFDARDGVVAVLGARVTVFATRDGGAHWAAHPFAFDPGSADAISASFVDIDHGWMLQAGYDVTHSTDLMRTDDGGATWINLGAPVRVPTEAFGVTFADRTHGWLDTDSTGPFAYRTSDAGLTWGPVTLPAPAAGWPAPAGTFFVAARPTEGHGVMATVVDPYQYGGRSGAGATVIDYPPLTMKTYDGGAPVVFMYTTLADSSSGGILHVEDAIHAPGPAAQVQPADQVGLSSIDGGATWNGFATPGAGTIGYADATNWWWIGPGACSKSPDAGRTWSAPRACVVNDPLPGSLQVLDGSHAWVSAIVGSKTVLFSTSDGGARWTEASLSG